MNLYLSKSYDKGNWIFFRLSLIQLGMKLNSMKWIMGCIKSSYFIVLINGSLSTSFFHSSKGLHQGCPLSPLLFLIVTDSLGILLKNARSNEIFKGLKISDLEIITHLIFVDDVILFGVGIEQELIHFK